MTTNAIGASAHELVGQTVVTAYEIPDSDRRETLLLLDNGRVICLSCDPGYKDEFYTVRDPTRWECCMYDATDTPAGQEMKKLDAGQWL